MLTIIQKTYPEALPIVALISFLVGAYSGVCRSHSSLPNTALRYLWRTWSELLWWEMGAIMVGIVMSGRTECVVCCGAWFNEGKRGNIGI
ncbi:MAG: ABC transporter permease [Bacilli bacterium]